MRQTALLFFFILCMLQTVSAQTYSSVIPDNEILSFIEWIADSDNKSEKRISKKERKLSAKIIPWKKENLLSRYKTDEHDYLEIDKEYLFKRSNEGMDTLFTESDKDFFLRQFEGISNTTWKGKIAGSNPEKPEREGNNDLRFYSLPLFSANKEYAIIYRGYDCGYGCMSGRYNLYKLDYNKWRFVISIEIKDESDFYDGY